MTIEIDGHREQERPAAERGGRPARRPAIGATPSIPARVLPPRTPPPRALPSPFGPTTLYARLALLRPRPVPLCADASTAKERS